MSNDSAPEQLLAEPADAVEALWAKSGDKPDLVALLASHPHWSPRELRIALLVDQQFRGLTSQPWSTEDYLALAASLPADNDLTLDLIYGECRERSRQGNPFGLTELVRRFPHLSDRLERQIEIASWFKDHNSSDSQPVGEDSSSIRTPGTTRFGDYELHQEIARGGMGVIYRARHRQLKRFVALKMIRPERLTRAADLRRFKNETRIMAQLDHPNIIPILHIDQIDGIHFFTMRLVEGRDLEARRTEYMNNLPRAAGLILAVAEAIHYAHEHGVLHRDLKPSNVLVDESGVPFVVDFGLASHQSEASQLGPSVEFQGTPAYAAPELIQDESLSTGTEITVVADAASVSSDAGSIHHEATLIGAPFLTANVAVDVYGLGAILYVLITGHPPFSGRNSLVVWDKIRQTEPPHPRTLNTRIDRDLEAICVKALAKNPAARYASAAAFAKDLDRYLARKPVAARPIGRWHRRARWLRRHTVGRTIALTIALTGAVAAFALLAVIAVQSIALRDQKEKTEAAHLDVELYRQALKDAEEKLKHQQALTAQPPSLP